MASSFSLKIENLRKRSRVILTRLEENAKVVRKEVKNLRLKDPNSDIWKLRNDSSSVSAALCPDYFRLSPKYESFSEPDMNINRRLIIKSDRKCPQLSPQRRGIKECYCYASPPDIKKINQRSNRAKRKARTSGFTEINDGHYLAGGEKINDEDFSYHRSENEDLNNPEYSYSPPLSGATLIRAQKIDYTPRSKFLRKVQSKVNSLRSSSPGSQTRLTPRSTSSSPRRLISQNVNTLGKNLEARSRAEFPRKHKCRCFDNEAVSTMNKIPKKTLLPKKTIVSKRTANEQPKSIHCNKPTLRSPSLGRRVVRVIGKDSFMSREKIEDKNLRNSLHKDDEETCPCSFHEGGKFTEDFSEDDTLDFGINNVRKFRDKNYFDTHASNPSLLGSRSSGSVRQFRLNERLFPEPMGRIHRDDIVVSIPPCATKQKKAIHYFPRSIIKQEKNSQNLINNTKKRRCPSCPLIGHAVDLGALKVSHPTNSLALRYQKGIP